jgi:hypothetical protein
MNTHRTLCRRLIGPQRGCRHFRQENVSCTWWESNPESSNLSPGHTIDWAIPLQRLKERYKHQSLKFISLGFVIEFNLVYFRQHGQSLLPEFPLGQLRHLPFSCSDDLGTSHVPSCLCRITVYWSVTNYSQHLTRKRYWFHFHLLNPLW